MSVSPLPLEGPRTRQGGIGLRFPFSHLLIFSLPGFFWRSSDSDPGTLLQSDSKSWFSLVGPATWFVSQWTKPSAWGGGSVVSIGEQSEEELAFTAALWGPATQLGPEQMPARAINGLGAHGEPLFSLTGFTSSFH